MDDNPVKWAMAKLFSAIMACLGAAWAELESVNWSKPAAFVAFLYTCVLLGEWLWKKLHHKRKCPEAPPSRL